MTWYNPAEIAHRDARRLARVLQEVGGEGASIGGGWMACDRPGSWATYAAGLGLDGPVSDAVLDELVGWYEARGRVPEVQTTPYQHPSLFTGLAARGLSVHELETVLVRPPAGARGPEVAGLAFRPVDPTDPARVRSWVQAMRDGFFPEGDAPPAMDAIHVRVARCPRVRLWLLELDGEIVGTGGLELFEGSAVLFAGCVLPPARRRGLHQAFLAHRLSVAADLGCHTALIGSTPGGPTERNALRLGFRVAYTQVGMRRGG